MSNNPNVFTDLATEQTFGAAFEPGDVALVLKKDGSVQAINFGFDKTRLAQPNELLTDDDKLMQMQGAKLFALALAAQHPQIMDMLLAIATDPEVVDFDKLRQSMTKH